MEKGPEGPAHPLLRLRMCHNVVRALPYDRRLRRPGHAHGRHQPYVGHRALRASLSSRPAHAGTAEPLRVSPPEAVAYLLELISQVVSLPFRKEFSTIYFPFPTFFSEIYLDPTHSGYQYTHP